MARARIPLTRRCPNVCRFCAQAQIPEVEFDPSHDLQRARSDHDGVTFVGGEPTISDTLPGAIDRARELGFSAIGLQTNGHALADRLEGLSARGLTDLHLSLHGPDAAVHDHHTGRDGSYQEVVAAAERARALALPFVVCTVITRSNFRVVAQVGERITRLGAAAWLCQFVTVAGRAGPNLDGLLPRLAMAVPHVLHATHQTRSRGLPSYLRGAPACLLGPYARFALPDPHAVHAPVCQGCAARSECAGVDPIYLQRFGDGELHPREPVGPGEREPVADAFVGVGPRVDPELPHHLGAP